MEQVGQNSVKLEETIVEVPARQYVYSAVPANLIDVMWHLLEPHVQRVVDLAADEISLDSIRMRAKQGDTTIATVSIDGEILAIFTIDIRTFDSGKKALYLPLIAGSEFFDWMPGAFEIVKRIARQENCFEVRGIAARSGWMRKMKNYGWYVVHEIIAVNVEDDEE